MRKAMIMVLAAVAGCWVAGCSYTGEVGPTHGIVQSIPAGFWEFEVTIPQITLQARFDPVAGIDQLLLLLPIR